MEMINELILTGETAKDIIYGVNYMAIQLDDDRVFLFKPDEYANDNSIYILNILGNPMDLIGKRITKATETIIVEEFGTGLVVRSIFDFLAEGTSVSIEWTGEHDFYPKTAIIKEIRHYKDFTLKGLVGNASYRYK